MPGLIDLVEAASEHAAAMAAEGYEGRARQIQSAEEENRRSLERSDIRDVVRRASPAMAVRRLMSPTPPLAQEIYDRVLRQRVQRKALHDEADESVQRAMEIQRQARQRWNGVMSAAQAQAHARELQRAQQLRQEANLLGERRKRNSVQARSIGADRRMNNFGTVPKTIYGNFAQVAPKYNGRLRFIAPWKVMPCVIRKTRREVLFAKKFAGGRGSRRPKRFTPYSHISCY
jgi:hypothetical protein